MRPTALQEGDVRPVDRSPNLEPTLPTMQLSPWAISKPPGRSPGFEAIFISGQTSSRDALWPIKPFSAVTFGKSSTTQNFIPIKVSWALNRKLDSLRGWDGYFYRREDEIFLASCTTEQFSSERCCVSDTVQVLMRRQPQTTSYCCLHTCCRPEACKHFNMWRWVQCRCSIISASECVITGYLPSVTARVGSSRAPVRHSLSGFEAHVE